MYVCVGGGGMGVGVGGGGGYCVDIRKWISVHLELHHLLDMYLFC